MLDDDISPQENKCSIFRELRDNTNLPPSKKSLTRLEQEGTLLVMAGTRPTAKSIGIARYHLPANPETIQRVRSELRTVPDSASWTEPEQLPYLCAVIAQANRLSFGVTVRVYRIAPDEDLWYKEHTIPTGTPVGMTVHTEEIILPDPRAFKPERWLGQEGIERQKYKMAFHKGSRSCVAINLDRTKLFLVLATVAIYDMKLFETDSSDVGFHHDYHVAYPKLGSQGIRAMVLVKANMKTA